MIDFTELLKYVHDILKANKRFCSVYIVNLRKSVSRHTLSWIFRLQWSNCFLFWQKLTRIAANPQTIKELGDVLMQWVGAFSATALKIKKKISALAYFSGLDRWYGGSLCQLFKSLHKQSQHTYWCSQQPRYKTAATGKLKRPACACARWQELNLFSFALSPILSFLFLSSIALLFVFIIHRTFLAPLRMKLPWSHCLMLLSNN